MFERVLAVLHRWGLFAALGLVVTGSWGLFSAGVGLIVWGVGLVGLWWMNVERD